MQQVLMECPFYEILEPCSVLDSELIKKGKTKLFALKKLTF